METKIISADLTELEKRYQQTLEALADVDAGLIVKHEIVESWARNLGTAEHDMHPEKFPIDSLASGDVQPVNEQAELDAKTDTAPAKKT
ncbi:MAG: hypothetical protein KGI75_24355 [Rhizobiaceae bacterium]|nr:hypothetical protein [Rhizobiaceae bacterium]